jgi:AcrR family transcriptional regulator
MTDQKRPYRMSVRAELQEATRRRIAASAAELHATLGPSRTSMSAVAEHAGVQRSTLYRHFPDEGALFAACTAHWMSRHPLPDIEKWAALHDPDARLHRALSELYAYYEGAEPMLVNILRDLDAMEVVQHEFAPFEQYMEAAQATLMLRRRLRGRRLHMVRAAIGHALAFTTWQSLVREQQCTPAEAVEMMSRLATVSRS